MLPHTFVLASCTTLLLKLVSHITTRLDVPSHTEGTQSSKVFARTPLIGFIATIRKAGCVCNDVEQYWALTKEEEKVS